MSKVNEEKPILAQKLKKYRKEAGLTQEDIASALGINRSAYAYYEIGTTSPKPETLFKIAKIYNISSDELFRDQIDVAQIEELVGDVPLVNLEFNDLSDIEKKLVVKTRLMSSDKLKKFVELLNEI